MFMVLGGVTLVGLRGVGVGLCEVVARQSLIERFFACVHLIQVRTALIWASRIFTEVGQDCQNGRFIGERNWRRKLNEFTEKKVV